MALLTRCWQAPASVVTAILIAVELNDVQQGLYFTILSLLQLQNLADSGLQTVLMHAVSHDWSPLRLDSAGRLRGPSNSRHRVAAMARFAAGWFAIAAALFAVVAIIAGGWILGSQEVAVAWWGPLLAVIGFATASVIHAPLITVLEGCGQIQRVHAMRLVQAILGSFAIWSSLLAGWGLYALVASAAVQWICEITLLVGWHRRFWWQIWRSRAPKTRLQAGSMSAFDWRAEFWPLQWRLAVHGGVRQLAMMPLIPTLYAFSGPAIAGQVGMTLNVLTNISLLAYAWIRTRAPEMGVLIFEGNQARLRRIFGVATAGSTGLLVLALVAFLAMLSGLQIDASWDKLADLRDSFLMPTAAIGFCIAMVPLHLEQCLSMFIRAHKVDPIWHITTICNVVLGVVLFAAARWTTPAITGWAMAGVLWLISGPAVWWVFVRFVNAKGTPS